jgi:hypothetical protein
VVRAGFRAAAQDLGPQVVGPGLTGKFALITFESRIRMADLSFFITATVKGTGKDREGVSDAASIDPLK